MTQLITISFLAHEQMQVQIYKFFLKDNDKKIHKNMRMMRLWRFCINFAATFEVKDFRHYF